jgi:hypothetical protein
LSTTTKIYAKPLNDKRLDEQFKALSDFDVLLMHSFCLKNESFLRECLGLMFGNMEWVKGI